MRHSPKPVLFLILAVVLAGCGGGSRSPTSHGFGTASFTVEWPSRSSRLAVAESVRIIIRDGGTVIANQVLNRSGVEVVSTLRIEPIPAGDFVVVATAYSQLGGSGAPEGQGSAPISIQSGATRSMTLSAAATLDHIELSADKTSIAVNGTANLVATPKSSSDAIVFVPTGSLEWESLNAPIASVDSAGIVTGLTKGIADIKVTENGAGLNATVQIIVSGSAWTVMVYMAADNDLEQYAIEDMNEMETVGSTSSVSVVTQTDRSPGYDTSNGNWNGTRRYYITKDTDRSIVHSQMLADLGNLDMAAPSTLTNFVNWATQNYPAERYLLVLWDHGRGWWTRTYALQSVRRQVKAIFIDDSSANEMSLAGLTQALEQSPRTDVILFDACLMGMIEVAYSIRNCADVMVASEENIPVYGQEYGSLLSDITSNPDISSADLGRAMVDDYINSYAGQYAGTFTLSAVNLLLLDDLVSATDQLAGEIIANMSEVRTGVESAQSDAQRYDHDSGEYRYYKDLYDFARLVDGNVGNPAVRSAAQNVMSRVDDAVIYQRHYGTQVSASRGVAIYLPNSGEMLSMYDNLDFSAATRWNELIRAY